MYLRSNRGKLYRLLLIFKKLLRASRHPDDIPREN